MAAGAPDFYHPHFTVTVPAGTIIGNPLVTLLSSGQLVLDEVEVRIPPGPSGNVGFRIVWSGKQLVPWGETKNWIVADDEKLPFAIGLEVDTQLTLEAYNLDVYDHTLFVRLTQHEVNTSGVAAMPAMLPVSAIDIAAELQG